jgi:hypothetical protein
MQQAADCDGSTDGAMLPSAQQVASTGQTFRMKTMELKVALRHVQPCRQASELWGLL